MNLREEIEKIEKEILETESKYRKKDLIKYLMRLKRKEKENDKRKDK